MKKKDQEQEIEAIQNKAEKAIKKAVHKAILDHARTNDSMVIWRNGKVVKVPAKQLLAREKSARYRRKKI